MLVWSLACPPQIPDSGGGMKIALSDGETFWSVQISGSGSA